MLGPYSLFAKATSPPGTDDDRGELRRAVWKFGRRFTRGRKSEEDGEGTEVGVELSDVHNGSSARISSLPAWRGEDVYTLNSTSHICLPLFTFL